MASRFLKAIPEYIYICGEGEWKTGPYIHAQSGRVNRKFLITEVPMDEVVIKKKTPTSLKGWQKLYSDAIKFTADSGTMPTDKGIINMIYGLNSNAKILQDSTWATMSKNGLRVHINVITSKIAGGNKK